MRRSGFSLTISPEFERRVSTALPDVSQTVFDGAVSFDFNTGAIHKASWVKAFNRGDRATARRKLMLWVKAGGRTLTGLVNRREAEARLIFDGDYGSLADRGTPSERAMPPIPVPRPTAPARLAAGRAGLIGAALAVLGGAPRDPGSLLELLPPSVRRLT